MGRHRLVFAFLSGALALALAAPAAAEDVAVAEALFNRGLADMQAGRFDAGCPALSESYRLDPRPGVLFTLAECEAKRGRIATAVTRYGDYLALFSRLSPEAQGKQKGREKIATTKRAELAPLVPELTLSLPPDAPRGTVVKRDDAVLAEAALGIALPIDPGEHVVTTQAPAGPLTELRLSIAKGEKKQLTLQVKGAPSTSSGVVPGNTAPPSGSSTPLKPSDAGARRRRTGVFIAAVVGGAGLALGGVTGALAIREKGIVDDSCDKNLICSHAGKEAVDRGRALAGVSTVSVGVGLVGVGTAVVLLLTAPSSPPPRSAVRHAPVQEVSGGVWSTENRGTVAGIQGVW